MNLEIISPPTDSEQRRYLEEGAVIFVVALPTEEGAVGGVGASTIAGTMAEMLGIPVIRSGKMVRELAAHELGKPALTEAEFESWQRQRSALTPKEIAVFDHKLDSNIYHQAETALSEHKLVIVETKLGGLLNPRGVDPSSLEYAREKGQLCCLPALVIGITAHDVVSARRMWQRQIDKGELTLPETPEDAVLQFLGDVQTNRQDRLRDDQRIYSSVYPREIPFVYNHELVKASCHLVFLNNEDLTPEARRLAVQNLLNQVANLAPSLATVFNPRLVP